MLLVKPNIRLLMSLNCSLLKTSINSNFRQRSIQTIDCIDDINLHHLYHLLSDSFIDFVIYDSVAGKLFFIVQCFTTNPLTTRSI